MANAVSPVSMPAGTPLAAPVYLVINDGSVVSTTNGIPVNVVTGTVTVLSVGATGAAVPADADYIGWNSGSNLVGVSTANPLPVSATHGSVIDATNSSTATLLGNGVFTGTSQSSLPYSALSIEVFADQASAANGLQVEQSTDGTNWDTIDTFTISASADFQTTVNLIGSKYRIVYTNGSVGQGTFRLQTVAQTQDVVLPRVLTALGNLKIALQESSNTKALYTTATVTSGSGNSGDLSVSSWREISIDITTTLVTTNLQFFWERKGADGNYYALWQSALLTASANTLSTSVGPGLAYNQSLGLTGRFRWVATGNCSFTPNIYAK